MAKYLEEHCRITSDRQSRQRGPSPRQPSILAGNRHGVGPSGHTILGSYMYL